MVDAADALVLAVLTRAPSSRGKTRLFASLGLSPDPGLLAALLLDTLDGVAVPGVRRVVAVTPGSACDEIRALLGRLKPAPTKVKPAPTKVKPAPTKVKPAAAKVKPAPTKVKPAPANESIEPGAIPDVDVEVMAQPDGDLGERMRATMTALFARGAPAVALVGSDVPHITAATIAEAFALVVRDPDALVLGPAADGGYYLIAARRVPDVFSGITWGSEQVRAQTERAAAAHQFHVHHLPAMADVDTADDLYRAARTGLAPRTAAWLRTHAAHLTW
jgi:glycosyltransferase A (GT-A) superfamily protein (DUF2064 family)